MTHTTPPDYEKKFRHFIHLCTTAKIKGADSVIISFPWVLGDNYDEVIESLSRLANAGLSLKIATQKDWLN